MRRHIEIDLSYDDILLINDFTNGLIDIWWNDDEMIWIDGLTHAH
jgi:hypothetical protein